MIEIVKIPSFGYDGSQFGVKARTKHWYGWGAWKTVVDEGGRTSWCERHANSIHDSIVGHGVIAGPSADTVYPVYSRYRT